MEFTIFVAGSSRLDDAVYVFGALERVRHEFDRIHQSMTQRQEPAPLKIFCGNNPGTDALVASWAKERGLKCKQFNMQTVEGSQAVSMGHPSLMQYEPSYKDIQQRLLESGSNFVLLFPNCQYELGTTVQLIRKAAEAININVVDVVNDLKLVPKDSSFNQETIQNPIDTKSINQSSPDKDQSIIDSQSGNHYKKNKLTA